MPCSLSNASGPRPPYWKDTRKIRGDLARAAALPQIGKVLGDLSTPQQRNYFYDEQGFRNPTTSNGDRLKTREIVVTGASFMHTGSTNAHAFSGQLAAMTNLPTFNAAWPEGGPYKGLFAVLEDPEFGQRQEKFLIYGIIQRNLNANRLHSIDSRITETGELLPETRSNHRHAVAHELLGWHKKMESYVEQTSSIGHPSQAPTCYPIYSIEDWKAMSNSDS